MAGIASAVCTCDASSKITTSKRSPGASTCETTCGLIAQHGFAAASTSGHSRIRSPGVRCPCESESSARSSAPWSRYCASVAISRSAVLRRTRRLAVTTCCRSASANSSATRRNRPPSCAPYAGSPRAMCSSSEDHQTRSSSAPTTSAPMPRWARSANNGSRPAWRSRSRRATARGTSGRVDVRSLSNVSRPVRTSRSTSARSPPAAVSASRSESQRSGSATSW